MTTEEIAMAAMNPKDAEAMWREVERKTSARAESMPTEEDAIRQMFDAYVRLTELGWRSATYCPKARESVRLLEAGCGAAGVGFCEEAVSPFPARRFTMFGNGDLWPSSPVLFKPIEDTHS